MHLYIAWKQVLCSRGTGRQADNDDDDDDVDESLDGRSVKETESMKSKYLELQ